MKTHSIYHYRAKAKEAISAFQNNFLNKFWAYLPIDHKLPYYHTNNALCAAINENVVMVGAEFTVDVDMVRVYGKDKADDIAKEALARQISEAILKSDRISVSRLEDRRCGDLKYSFELAILSAEEKK